MLKYSTHAAQALLGLLLSQLFWIAIHSYGKICFNKVLTTSTGVNKGILRDFKHQMFGFLVFLSKHLEPSFIAWNINILKSATNSQEKVICSLQ